MTGVKRVMVAVEFAPYGERAAQSVDGFESATVLRDGGEGGFDAADRRLKAERAHPLLCALTPGSFTHHHQ